MCILDTIRRLFVCLWFFVPLENFSLIWSRHHNLSRAPNFYIYSALMAIEQWGFPNMWHLLYVTVYNGHLRGPVTLMPTWCRVYGSGAVTTCFNDWSLFKSGIEPRSPACEAKALQLHFPSCMWLMNDTVAQHIDCFLRCAAVSTRCKKALGIVFVEHQKNE